MAAKVTKSEKSNFSRLLERAFLWAAENGKLGNRGRHESEFAKICGTNLKNIRRWRDSVSAPKRDNWLTLKNGLIRAGYDIAEVTRLERVRDGIELAQPDSSMTPLGSEIEASAPPHFIVSHPFPKLCAIELDVPSQGSSVADFIVVGQVRFARAPDMVDNHPVTVGVRRAVLLPVPKGCALKPGSLFRPPKGGIVGGDGASQVIFVASDQDIEAVLEGDQLRGGTVGRFVISKKGESAGVDFYVHLESGSDLKVSLTCAYRGRSRSQIKFAERWIATHLAKTVREEDGSLRLAGCFLRWEGPT